MNHDVDILAPNQSVLVTVLRLVAMKNIQNHLNIYTILESNNMSWIAAPVLIIAGIVVIIIMSVFTCIEDSVL